jgi:FtsZ-interacting cell division protein ZipA
MDVSTLANLVLIVPAVAIAAFILWCGWAERKKDEAFQREVLKIDRELREEIRQAQRLKQVSDDFNDLIQRMNDFQFDGTRKQKETFLYPAGYTVNYGTIQPILVLERTYYDKWIYKHPGD